MGSLFGSSSKGSSGSSSQSVTSSASQSTSGLSAKQVLDLYNANKSSTSGYSKEDALKDVQGTLAYQAQQAMQTYMPTNAKAQNSAGAYDSTTKQLLNDNSAAQTSAALASTALSAITDYATISNNTNSTNNALLSSLGSVANDTRTTVSQSSGQSTSDSSSNQHSGSGLVGQIISLFAEGGEVPDTATATNANIQKSASTSVSDDFMQTLMDGTGITKMLADVQNAGKLVTNLAQGNMQGAADAFKQSSGSTQSSDAQDIQDIMSIASLFFADGGKVPSDSSDHLLTLIKKRAGENDTETDADEPEKVDNPQEEATEGRSQAKPTPSMAPEQELLAAIKKYAAGGQVRSGEQDVQNNGGKIAGKQSPTGEDNQVIGVAGGEGIIPKDVMEVKGVPELLQKLIQTYHTPVNGDK